MATEFSQQGSGWPAGSGEMAERVRSHDWTDTSLGPIETWPQSLRAATDICLDAGFPSWVCWGRELTQIYNDAALTVFQDKHPAALGMPMRDCWPEIWPVIGPLVERVLSTGEPVVARHLSLVPDRGGPVRAVRFTFSYSALRNEDGAVCGLLVTVVESAPTGAEAERDESQRRLEEENKRHATLLAELQHRVRNTLAVVRSIARRTAETSRTAEECGMHLDGRLGAFARVQAAVTRNPIAGLDLEMLIADELFAVGAEEGDRVTQITGPKLRLHPKAAETLALVFHELATNAVKFGALSGPRGRIRVEWRIEQTDPPRVVLDWIENGMALPVLKPTRRGFGTGLLERTLPYDLGAEVRCSFESTGLRCTIVLPIRPDLMLQA